MNERIARLRQRSFEAVPSISIERGLLETEFYRANFGKYTLPVMRAMFFKYLCEKKTLYIGEDELIVGERGPGPKAVPTFPELNCHTGEDLKILNQREMTRFKITDADIDTYQTAYLQRSLKNGRPPTGPACLRSLWSSARPGTRPSMTLSTKGGCSISSRRSPTALRPSII